MHCALSMRLEIKPKKSEVNLLSLLSSFDDVIDTLPEEKDKVPLKEKAPKLPRTNSLEHLETKVCSFYKWLLKIFLCIRGMFLSFKPVFNRFWTCLFLNLLQTQLVELNRRRKPEQKRRKKIKNGPFRWMSPHPVGTFTNASLIQHSRYQHWTSWSLTEKSWLFCLL